MQPHEGPPRDRKAEALRRQNARTKWLVLAVLVLGALVALTLINRSS